MIFVVEELGFYSTTKSTTLIKKYNCTVYGIMLTHILVVNKHRLECESETEPKSTEMNREDWLEMQS